MKQSFGNMSGKKNEATYFASLVSPTYLKLIHLFCDNCLSVFNPSRPNPGRREKIKLNVYIQTSLGASRGFMKALKAFIKSFKAPQRSVKIKI